MTFRLLHISDLHLCIEPKRENYLSLFEKPRFSTLRKAVQGGLSMYPASYDPTLAEAAARFAFENARTLDGVIASGDLATTGLKEDLEVARDFVEGSGTAYLTKSGRPTLKNSSDLVFIAPGNHDRYHDVWANAGCNEFDKIFASRWGKYHPSVHHNVLEKDGVKLGLIAADFCLRFNNDAEMPWVKFRQEPVLRYGQGRVYADIVDELVNRTKTLRTQHENIAVLWIVHFPPMNKCKKILKLIDFQKLQVAAAEQEIEFILSGHVHVNTVSCIQSGTTILCAGSASSIEEEAGNWVHVIEIDADHGKLQGLTRTDYKWSETAGDFVEYASQQLHPQFKSQGTGGLPRAAAKST